MITTNAQIATDLNAAADLIEAGFTKHKMHGADNCHCALGAIGIATDYHIELKPPVVYDMAKGEPTDEVAEALLELDGFGFTLDHDKTSRYNAVRDALTKSIGIRPYSIPTWNDADERTQAEVVAAFRTAAAGVSA